MIKVNDKRDLSVIGLFLFWCKSNGNVGKKYSIKLNGELKYDFTRKAYGF